MIQIKPFRAGQQLGGAHAENLGDGDRQPMGGAGCSQLNRRQVPFGVTDAIGHLGMRPIPAEAQTSNNRAQGLVWGVLLAFRVGADSSSHSSRSSAIDKDYLQM